MVKCTYRTNTDCRMPRRAGSSTECQLCLIGQLCDETSLNTSAIMTANMDKMEDLYQGLKNKGVIK